MLVNFEIHQFLKIAQLFCVCQFVRENKKLIFRTKVETWKAMEKLVDNGKTRTIGLSNFNKTQIIEILSIPGIKHKPAVLQNESHPYLQEKDLRDFCRLSGIAFQVC